FAFEPLFAADEAGRPIVVAVIKATFRFDGHGDVWLADPQAPGSLAGPPSAESAVSSYRYEPEVAFVKPSTDVALIGHAHPPFAGATQVEVGIKIGSLRK